MKSIEEVEKKIREAIAVVQADGWKLARGITAGVRRWLDCGDGWYELIHDLSEKLEVLIVQLPEADREKYAAAQVKEKFGGLRFYMTCSTEEMDKLIAATERRSFSVCELCGAPGETRSGGWLKTLCVAHDEARKRAAT